MNFKKYAENLAITGLDDKIRHIARRIMAFTLAAANQARSKGKDFNYFKSFAANYNLHPSGIYSYLTTRMGGKEDANKFKELTNFIEQLKQGAIKAGAQYVKGTGWHHFIINGDMPRGPKGTAKAYIPLHYEKISNAEQIMSAIVAKLISNGYKGQLKIGSDPQMYQTRYDNIVLHSGDQQMVNHGAQIAMSVIPKEAIGGAGTTGYGEFGLDIKGSDTSFNDFAAQKAYEVIAYLLKSTNDYDQFQRNVQNAFGPMGHFVNYMLKLV